MQGILEFVKQHFDTIITVSITILGFIVTYFMNKKSVQDELKKDAEKKKDSSLQLSDIFACDAFAGLDDIIIDWALEQLNDEILDAQIDGLNIAQIADQLSLIHI